MRILVIDDEVPTLKMFGLLLEALGHEPIAAESGEEGLIRFDRERPDVVLTDIKMPGIDGMDVLRALKEADPRIEVIVITGHGDTDLALAALGLRATDFIDKPIRRETLEAALGRANGRLDMAEAAGSDGDVAAALEGCVGVIGIRGNLTSESEPYLARAFRDLDAACGVLFDFTPNASVNGAGLDVLASVAETCRASGRRAAVYGLAENFVRILDRLGITDVAPRFTDRSKALAYLAETTS